MVKFGSKKVDEINLSDVEATNYSKKGYLYVKFSEDGKPFYVTINGSKIEKGKRTVELKSALGNDDARDKLDRLLDRAGDK